MFKMVQAIGSDKVELFRICVIIKEGLVNDIQFTKLKAESHPRPKYREEAVLSLIKSYN
jgi:hypothetical protein